MSGGSAETLQRKSSWRIARNSRQAVKIGVLAGNLGQAVMPHDCQNKSIIAEESGLPTQRRGCFDEGFGNRQDANAHLGNLGNRLMELAQSHYRRRILPESLDNL